MSGKLARRAYRYRFYPTPDQADLLCRTFGCVRYVWNRALAERSRAWTQEQRRVTFADTCRQLTDWKNEPDTGWLYEVSNVALQQGLQHLHNAYLAFWGKRARYPTFKKKGKSRNGEQKSMRKSVQVFLLHYCFAVTFDASQQELSPNVGMYQTFQLAQTRRRHTKNQRADQMIKKTR